MFCVVHVSVRVGKFARVRVRVRVCACARARARACVSVCVSVLVHGEYKMCVHVRECACINVLLF